MRNGKEFELVNSGYDEAGEFTRGPPEIEADPTDIARDSPDASGRGDL